MSKFQIAAVTVQKFTCEDGKQFDTAAEAEAHQFGLENAEKLEVAVESYLNKFQYKNRSRQQKKTVAKEFYAFFLGWDGETIERTVQDDEVVPAVKADEAAIAAEDVPAAEVEVESTTEVSESSEDDLF